MQNFVSFWASMFDIVCDFLLSDPIIYFVGLFILIVIVGFIKEIVTISK